jgi:hypothetical protein
MTGAFDADPFQEGVNTAFARAVAVVLGDSSQEPELRRRLDEFYTQCDTDHRRYPHLRDLPASADADAVFKPRGDVTVDKDVTVVEEVFDGGWLRALEYLACVALSWVRAKRDLESGADLGGILTLTDAQNRFAAWPVPGVPQGAEAFVPALKGTQVRDAGEMFPSSERDMRPEHQKVPDEATQPNPPAIIRTDRYHLRVPEAERLVRLPSVVQAGDSVTLEPVKAATIWSGVTGHFNTGPQGYDWSDQDQKFPLRAPPFRPYALIYKFVEDPDTVIGTVDVLGMTITITKEMNAPWVYLGAEPYSFPATTSGALFFRTNDDTPGNGGGAFEVIVAVARRS